MTAERLLATLTVIAAGLLVTAVMVTGGKVPSLGNAALGLPLPAFASTGEGTPFIAGIAAGWLLRWVYAMPWATLPRAVVAWVLGWRSSVIMLGVAIGCMAILVLY